VARRKKRPIDRDGALAELAHRYLAGHGPATDSDLAYWSGLALRDARAGLKAIGSEVVERGGGLLSLKGRRSTSDRPPPRLLGSFDPLLFGWGVPRACARRPWRCRGIGRPFPALRHRRRKGRGDVDDSDPAKCACIHSGSLLSATLLP